MFLYVSLSFLYPFFPERWVEMMLTAAEAAQLLHLNVKHVQRLAHAGRLPATRVGRKWLFRRADLDALLGVPAAAPPPTFGLSARNQLRARVVALTTDRVMAEVRLRVGDVELVSMITSASAERLRLAVGDTVFAVIKATEIMIGKA